MKKIKRRINWIKVVALIFMIIEIAIAFKIGRHVKGDLNLWRIYTGCVFFIPIDMMIILCKMK